MPPRPYENLYFLSLICNFSQQSGLSNPELDAMIFTFTFNSIKIRSSMPRTWKNIFRKDSVIPHFKLSSIEDRSDLVTCLLWLKRPLATRIKRVSKFPENPNRLREPGWLEQYWAVPNSFDYQGDSRFRVKCPDDLVSNYLLTEEKSFSVSRLIPR